ncbi:hypothetical protein NKH77_38930 [Streptomyces sp. M19]
MTESRCATAVAEGATALILPPTDGMTRPASALLCSACVRWS